MKRNIILTLLLTVICSTMFAQEHDSDRNNQEFRTLLGPDHHNGFYGAFSIGYTEIENRQAVTFGGRLEWITGHSLGLGFGGTGFINENHFEPSLNRNVFLTGGYGGVYLEPIVLPNSPVHIAFPILLGAGGISYITENMNFDHNMVEDSEAFLLAEPAVELELNLTRNFRLAIGTSYRFTTPFDIGVTGSPAINSKALQGFTCMMTFKFGRF